jgi:hypothetical protein
MTRPRNSTGVIIGVLACCWGVRLASAVENIAPAAPQFAARTEDGRSWSGPMATLDIRPELPDGTPAVAELSFAVTDTKGNIFGMRAEINPDSLLRSAHTGWQISLDYVPSSKPGSGILSYAANPNVAPTAASKGTLTGFLREKVLEGTFSSNAKGIASGTFEGSYLVRCWAARRGAASQDQHGSVRGDVSSGYVTLEDSSFATPFCSRFGDL